MVSVGEGCRNLVQCCEVNRRIVCAKTSPVIDVISFHLVRILEGRQGRSSTRRQVRGWYCRCRDVPYTASQHDPHQQWQCLRRNFVKWAHEEVISAVTIKGSGRQGALGSWSVTKKFSGRWAHMSRCVVALIGVICGKFMGLGAGGRMHAYADLMGGRDAGR